MNWGNSFEVYVGIKEGRYREEMGQTVAVVSIKGESWEGKEISGQRRDLKKFINDLDNAIEKYGIENLCVRTNQ